MEGTVITAYQERLDELFNKEIDHNLEELQSFANLTCHNNGDITYWFEGFDLSSKEENTFTQRFVQSEKSDTCLIKFNLFDKYRRVNKNILPQYLHWSIVKVDLHSDYKLQIKDQIFQVEIKKLSWSPRQQKIFTTNLYLLLLLISALIVKRIKKLTIPKFLGIAMLVIFTTFFIQYFIHGSTLTKLQIFSEDNYFDVLNPSFGALILNIIAFSIIVGLFFKTQKYDISSKVDISKYFIAYFFSLGLYDYVIINIIACIHKSGIALNVENILQFDKYSLLYILLVISILFLGFLVQNNIVKTLVIANVKRSNRTLAYLIICVIHLGFSYCFLSLNMAILLAIFLLALSLMIDIYNCLHEKSILWLLWWIIIYAAFLSIVLFAVGLQKQIIDRTNKLSHIYHEVPQKLLKDLVAIREDSTVTESIEQIIQSPTNSLLDQNDIEEYLSSVINLPKKYTWKINLFDSLGTSLLLQNRETKRGFKSSLPYLKNISRRIYFDHLIGQFVLVLEGRNNQSFTNPNLNLIVKTEAKKIELDNYSLFLQTEVQYSHGLSSNTHSQYSSLSEGVYYFGNTAVIIHQVDNNIKLISTQKVAKILKPLSLFSYLFCLIGCYTILSLYLISKFSPQWLGVLSEINLLPLRSLRTKIQISVLVLIIFSFIVIGIVTVFFFSNELKRNEQIGKNYRIDLLIKDIDSRLSEITSQDAAINAISSQLFELKKVHNVDLRLYNNQGYELFSSISDQSTTTIPYNIYKTILKDGKTYNSYIESNQDIYIKLSPNGLSSLGILQVKTPVSRGTTYKITEFISTILNVYVFLFLLAGAIAIAIANSITEPLNSLSRKLKEIKLGRKNQELIYNSKDEVGQLIITYNRMIKELESSVNILARTERDMAWREMAKQVAHEIKNPLTPMKLSIQYLEKAIESRPEEAMQLIGKVSNTLIEQIDNLSQIAGEFSNFGTMPTANNEKIVLNEIVEAVHDLFRKREDMDIHLEEPINDIYVYADRNHLIRILNNILKNSIQAIPDGRRGSIYIQLKSTNDNAIIAVKDNGSGIPEHMRDKVFTPNFTTKSSGTGLGLAISSTMMQSFNGRIYYESKENVGTTFYLEIPLMRLDDNRDKTNRVFLD